MMLLRSFGSGSSRFWKGEVRFENEAQCLQSVKEWLKDFHSTAPAIGASRDGDWTFYQ
jgi:hypothetical protein